MPGLTLDLLRRNISNQDDFICLMHDSVIDSALDLPHEPLLQWECPDYFAVNSIQAFKYSDQVRVMMIDEGRGHSDQGRTRKAQKPQHQLLPFSCDLGA